MVTNKYDKFSKRKYPLNFLKQYLIKNQSSLKSIHYWPTVWVENHDFPRMTSKICSNNKFEPYVSKMLAVLILSLRGTSFIYQGQELGAVNQKFNSINDLRDIESKNLYNQLIKQGKSTKDAFEYVVRGSRDNARVPIAWDKTKNGGFSKSNNPWIFRFDNYKKKNVKSEQKNTDSVLNFFKKMIDIRTNNKDILVYGNTEFKFENIKNYFVFERTDNNNNKMIIEINLSNKRFKSKLELKNYQILLSNYKKNSSLLKPYQANIFVQKSK
jgi:oligo-1,6-glucosidase